MWARTRPRTVVDISRLLGVMATAVCRAARPSVTAHPHRAPPLFSGWWDSHAVALSRAVTTRHTHEQSVLSPHAKAAYTDVPTPADRRPYGGAGRARQARARVRRGADHPGGHRAGAPGRVPDADRRGHEADGHLR